MENNNKTTPDRYQLSGLGIILLSALTYGTAIFGGLKEDHFFGIFVLNYTIAALYFFFLWFSGRLRSGRGGLNNFFLSLVLFLISAYALNHLLPVFELSVNWLCVVLVIVSCTYCSLGFFNRMGNVLRLLVTFILGIGFALFLYLSIYLLPLYIISVPASLALGISLHSFVPLLFVIFTLVWLFKKVKQYQKILYPFLGGVALSLVVVIIFSLQWSSLDRMVASRYQHILMDEDTALPSWIKVAQEMPDSWITERYLKTGLVYSKADLTGEWSNWGIPSRNFDEVKKHDPLVMIATFFNSGNPLNTDERIKILEAEYDSRHKTEDRLWSGSDLATSNVISNIRIWPQFRIAYTEKTITVQNRDKEQRWMGNQEAIYTFHLPEGGVVTSLSLWINGQEAKGVLTTKGKADSAYREIVGVENRDPSVVHWQEGNRVSVRVFPVTAGGNRIFKIGVTAPLASHGDRLQYENIYFEGPDAESAKEIVQVDWEQEPDQGLMKGFEEKGNDRFIKERNYRKDWILEFKAPPLARNAFSFSGNTYHIDTYKPSRQAVAFDRIYLDVNASWSEAEFTALVAACKGKQLFVYDDGLIRVKEENSKACFERLHKKHFSLFPLQAIGDPATALLVTRSGKASPDISDLKETAFATRLEAWLDRDQPLCVFNLGRELNPYLKTLKEHRAFRYEQGDVAALIALCRQNIFAANGEDQDHVVIDNSGIILSRSSDSLQSNAPDHFMRLFAYNHLMQQLKQGLFTNKETDTALVAEAQQAYVVSPLSSLVVLESAADYERFNIKDSQNSLKNASLNSKGAVPEPGEWALIIVSALLLLWVCYQHKIRKLWSRL